MSFVRCFIDTDFSLQSQLLPRNRPWQAKTELPFESWNVLAVQIANWLVCVLHCRPVPCCILYSLPLCPALRAEMLIPKDHTTQALLPPGFQYTEANGEQSSPMRNCPLCRSFWTSLVLAPALICSSLYSSCPVSSRDVSGLHSC